MVGDLQIDRSTEASIRFFAGTPAFSGEGTFEAAYAGYPEHYRVLAFECTGQHDSGLDPGAYRPTHHYCRTLYYLNPSTHRLAAFWTNSPRFRTAAGTRPGTRQAVADRLEHQHATIGALVGITLRTAAATLVLDNDGCSPYAGSEPRRCIGGTVTNFALESGCHGVGLLFV